MIIIGVDQGLKGGIARFELDINSLEYNVLDTHRMPIIGKNDIDVMAIHNIVNNEMPVVCATEVQFAKKGQGHGFVIARNEGMVEAACHLASGNAPHRVAARTWQAHFKKSGSKKASFKIVKNLLGIEGKTEGETEALLIGLYWVDRIVDNPSVLEFYKKTGVL